jgi:hypothetical protein
LVHYNPFDRPIKSICGPYIVTSKTGDRRRQITINFVDKKQTTVTLARWVMIQKLKRKLGRNEHVDHINEDSLDDREDNYQILSASEHQRKHIAGRPSPLKGIEKDWKHGSIYGWMKKKCVCSICTASRVEWHDRRNASRRTGSGYRKKEKRFKNL